MQMFSLLQTVYMKRTSQSMIGMGIYQNCSLKAMVISIVLNIGIVKFLKILHTVLIIKKKIFIDS